MNKPVKSVTHGQCDNRSVVTFSAARHHQLFIATARFIARPTPYTIIPPVHADVRRKCRIMHAGRSRCCFRQLAVNGYVSYCTIHYRCIAALSSRHIQEARLLQTDRATRCQLISCQIPRMCSVQSQFLRRAI